MLRPVLLEPVPLRGPRPGDRSGGTARAMRARSRRDPAWDGGLRNSRIIRDATTTATRPIRWSCLRMEGCTRSAGPHPTASVSGVGLLASRRLPPGTGVDGSRYHGAVEHERQRNGHEQRREAAPKPVDGQPAPACRHHQPGRDRQQWPPQLSRALGGKSQPADEVGLTGVDGGLGQHDGDVWRGEAQQRRGDGSIEEAARLRGHGTIGGGEGRRVQRTWALCAIGGWDDRVDRRSMPPCCRCRGREVDHD
jgi:hypothetical protein